MRLAAGAAVAGTAYHAGKRAQQEQVNDQAQAEYAATQGPPPPPPSAAPTDPATEVERLAQLHCSGALTDEEFAAAKAKVLSA